MRHEVALNNCFTFSYILTDETCCSFSSILPGHRMYGAAIIGCSLWETVPIVGSCSQLKNIPINKTILNEWLNTGYIEKKRLFPTEKGTPQGGTISQMIMNMILDGLERAINKKFPRWKNKKVNFIRYADDLVITAVRKEVITEEIIP